MPDLKFIAYDFAVLFNCIFGTNVAVAYAKSKFPGVWFAQF